MVKINSSIRSFSTDAYFRGKFTTVTDKDLMGNWSIIFFYPTDFTFVCPTELEDLADYYAEFQKLGVEIYSVSTDKHVTHEAWHDTSPAIGKIEHVMLADPTGAITHDFDVMIEEAGVADRATFLINPEGRILYIEITSGGVGRSATALLDKVRAAQYVAAHPGEVCPAKWREGDHTLSPSLDLIGKI